MADDEELYIPFCLIFIEKAMGWQYYNLVRPHYGTGMNGKRAFEKLKDLSCDLPIGVCLVFPLILDTISTNWLLETGNDLLAHYSFRDFWKNLPVTSTKILDRKMANIAASNADFIATGCPGCRLQLRLGVKRARVKARVIHPIELLNRAFQVAHPHHTFRA